MNVTITDVERATTQRILDAAEALFAQQGLAATSVRAITSAAKVNLAAAHYHFGSKEGLIRAVLERRIRPLNKERLRLLEACRNGPAYRCDDLQAIVEAFVAPALRLSLSASQGGPLFVRLMGRVHSEPAPLLIGLIRELFSPLIRRFREALQQALPHLDSEEVSWRLSFMVGTMAFTLAAPHAIRSISADRCDPTDVAAVRERLTSFIVAGLQAPAPASSDGLDPQEKRS